MEFSPGRTLPITVIQQKLHITMIQPEASEAITTNSIVDWNSLL